MRKAMPVAAGTATTGDLIACPPWPDRTSGQLDEVEDEGCDAMGSGNE
jgi:hypothetical protein